MARIWIADTNKFNLPAPPAWWQKIVFDYDKMLRLLPSRKDRLYRLGRVARRDAQLGLQSMTFHTHPDTQMMIQHGLVPISSVMPWAITSTKILRDLKARDLWANGAKDERGLERLLDDIDESENVAAVQAERQAAQELDHRNADGYRYMKAMLGERISINEADRGRRGKTAGTDRTRVAIAVPTSVRSNQSLPVPGVPSRKSSGPIPSIVLTDAR